MRHAVGTARARLDSPGRTCVPSRAGPAKLQLLWQRRPPPFEIGKNALQRFVRRYAQPGRTAEGTVPAVSMYKRARAEARRTHV